MNGLKPNPIDYLLSRSVTLSRAPTFKPLPLSIPTSISEIVIQSEAWNIYLSFLFIGGRMGKNKITTRKFVLIVEIIAGFADKIQSHMQVCTRKNYLFFMRLIENDSIFVLKFMKQNTMTITVQINTSTAAGRRIEKQLRRYPEAVQFIEPTIVSETIPDGYVSLKDGFDQVREHVKSVYRNNSISEK